MRKVVLQTREALKEYQQKKAIVKRINERIGKLYRVNRNAPEIELFMKKIEAKLGADFITTGAFSGAPKITDDAINVAMLNIHALKQLDASIPSAGKIIKKYKKLFEEDRELNGDDSAFQWPKDTKELANLLKPFWDRISAIERRLDRYLSDAKYIAGEGTFWKQLEREEHKRPTWSTIDLELKKRGY